MFRARSPFSLSTAPWIALGLGLVLTIFLFLGVRRLEHDKVDAAFAQNATARAAAITRGLSDAVDVLATTNRLFTVFRTVDREEFRSFTAPLLKRHPYIQALDFQRVITQTERPAFEAGMRKLYPDFVVRSRAAGKLVRSPEREHYRVVEYIEPIADNKEVLGFDAGSSAFQAEAMQRAVDTGEPTATDLLRLVKGGGSLQGLLVLMPVYRPGAALTDVQARRQAMVGATAAVFRLDDLTDKILGANGLLRAPGIDISVFAARESNEAKLAYRHGDAPGGHRSLGLLPGWLLFDQPDDIRHDFQIAGRPWHIVVSTKPVWFPLHHIGSMLTLAISLASTILLALLVQRLVSQSRRLVQAAANSDSLTGLANRNVLHARLQQAIDQADRDKGSAWVVFIKLDRFKVINDTLGHGSGDKVLHAIGDRLKSATRKSDTVARFGGDVFALILPETGDPFTPAHVAERVMTETARLLAVDGHDLCITCSVGIAVFPTDGTVADDLFTHADVAMSRAKRLGGNNFQFYAPEMNERALERLRLESELRFALERDEFELHYQPQVDLRTGRVVGSEALLRWRHPTLGMVPPAHFIGLAEDTGLIVPIGEWVLRTACLQNKAWQQAGIGPLRVAVNLSARQFAQRDLVQVVAQVLAEVGLEARHLELELTEGLVMADVDQAIDVLRALKALGVQISVDDFGTGHSSLSYLKRFPIDVLKIDRSFVNEITASPDDAPIAQLVIWLAHSLGMQVIAEGVEDAKQLAFLREHGCDQMQGFFFSPPISAQAFENLLRQGNRLDAPVAQAHDTSLSG
jgi:diguanylate cyclase (GGDEF)-like protein